MSGPVTTAPAGDAPQAPAAEITMAPVHTIAGHRAFIPSDRAAMAITADFLRAAEACSEGLTWFQKAFPGGCTYAELRAALTRQDWEDWIKGKVGGDTATAGDKGTATAGHFGTATAGDSGTATVGYFGTATAGYRGTATAGDSGTATVGDSGTATVGDKGTATAGYRGTATAGDKGTATAGDSGTATVGYKGTATAGDSGTISIQYFDYETHRYRVLIGYIGEGGLEAGKKYRVNDQAQFEVVSIDEAGREGGAK